MAIDPMDIRWTEAVMGSKSPQGTEARVCADIAKRQALGINKYGTTVAQNPLELRAWLQHQYEELLDAAVYCRRAIEEIDSLQRALDMHKEDGK